MRRFVDAAATAGNLYDVCARIKPLGGARGMPHASERRDRPEVASIAHDSYLSSVRIRLLIPAFLLFATPLSLAAQSDASTIASGRTPRRAILAVVGALVGGAGGAALHRDGSGTTCQPCTIGAGALIGGVAGLFIGREMDQAYALRYRGVPRLRIPFHEQPLDGDPLTLTARDTLVAVATSTGVTILSSTGSLVTRGRRANGIRGISALDLTTRTHALAVATPTGLYLYPPVRGAGVLLREGTIQAVTASEHHVFFSLGHRIEWAPLDADAERAWPGLDLGAPIIDLEWDPHRQILWALGDTIVLALPWRGDGLVTSSRTPVDPGGRSLTLHQDRMAVALGSAGVIILDASNPASPRTIARWSDARFVYDVALAGERLYAGAGPEGMFVIDVSGVPARTIGLAFDIGFAATLLSRDGYTYILDRRTSSVRRISTPTTR
jgi:hypothetical protein